MNNVKILCIIGTRPEAIKMAPVILALQEAAWAEVTVLATAQHRELLDSVLSSYGIAPDIDLNVMQRDQSLTQLTARLLQSCGDILLGVKPDLVLAQGDTTTVFIAALACFYNDIPFGHVEAGLRTFDIRNPFPEEINRVFTGKLSRFHFCPTQRAAENLHKEGIPASSIHVTGNTVIDALRITAAGNCTPPFQAAPSKRLLLVTAHRRESFGRPLENICEAINRITAEHADLQILFPVHPNPHVRDTVHRLLGDNPAITLSEPLDYPTFVGAMQSAYLILSDSGGVQEEAPFLGKPVLVLRECTERPEVLECGAAVLVGTDADNIIRHVNHLLCDPRAYSAMAQAVSPYGDGHAAERIVSILQHHFEA